MESTFTLVHPFIRKNYKNENENKRENMNKNKNENKDMYQWKNKWLRIKKLDDTEES